MWKRKSKVEKLMDRLVVKPGVLRIGITAFNDDGYVKYTAFAFWKREPGDVSPETAISGDTPLNALENLGGMIDWEIQLRGAVKSHDAIAYAQQIGRAKRK